MESLNEREDYLDKLLRGVEGESETKDDDFFSRFGSSVSDDDDEDFLKAFEKSKSRARGGTDSENGDDPDFGLDDIDSIVSNIKNGTLGELDGAGSLDDGRDLPIEESLKNYDDEDFGLNDIGAGYADLDVEPESDFEVNTLDGGAEPGYGSEDADQELLGILSGIGEDEAAGESSPDDLFSSGGGDFADEDFVDNLGGDMAKGAENEGTGSQAGGVEMEDLARQLENLGLDDIGPSDSAGTQAEGVPGTDKKGKKAKKNIDAATGGEKQGFFKRIGKLLFGEDDKVIDASDVDSLSEEDKADLKKIEDEEAAKERLKQEKSDQKEEKKEQKKKEKEEKKAQKAKAKAEKEAKPKKEKKKDIKVIERSKPLPKGPVVLIMLVGISLVILINLFSSQVGYTLNIAQARERYEQGDYVGAYSCFDQGSKVKAADEELYNKVRLTAYVQQQINSYRVYKKQNMHAEALSALVLGVGRYDKNANDAAAAGAAMEYDKMLSTIKKALKKQYSMSLDEARELYAIREKEEFTLEIYKVIDGLGLSAEE